MPTGEGVDLGLICRVPGRTRVPPATCLDWLTHRPVHIGQTYAQVEQLRVHVDEGPQPLPGHGEVTRARSSSTRPSVRSNGTAKLCDSTRQVPPE